MKRILVTGSRAWSNPTFIQEGIYSAMKMFGIEEEFVVVHGGALGADTMAQYAVTMLSKEGYQISEEIHLPDWSHYGRRAGIVRNEYMVDLGADVCLAFIRNNSPGASHCAAYSQESGIPTYTYREEYSWSYQTSSKSTI